MALKQKQQNISIISHTSYVLDPIYSEIKPMFFIIILSLSQQSNA